MWRILGIDKMTKRLVEVTVADNPQEKTIILRQEENNYDCVWAVRIRLPLLTHRMASA